MSFSDVRMHGDEYGHDARRNARSRAALAEATLACGDRVGESLRARVDRQALRAAVREFAHEVRAQGVPPERALASFKAMMFTLPAMQLRGAEERVGMVAELTRMAIEEYYSEDR
jgi:hypothetical protein